MKISYCGLLPVMAGAIALMPATTLAGNWWGSTPTNKITIGARSADGSKDIIRMNLAQAVTGPTGDVSVELRAHGEVLGRVTFQLGLDPHSLPLNFTAIAGELDTEFFISVPNRVFAPVANAMGRADANITMTDLNGDGATSSGMFGDAEFYRWDYNGTVPNGTLFDTQVSGPLDANPFGFASAGTNTPNGPGFTPIAPPVSILSGRVHFTLSAFDQAQGTGLFQITQIPGPGALALAGSSALCLLRRRRS